MCASITKLDNLLARTRSTEQEVAAVLAGTPGPCVFRILSEKTGKVREKGWVCCKSFTVWAVCHLSRPRHSTCRGCRHVPTKAALSLKHECHTQPSGCGRPGRGEASQAQSVSADFTLTSPRTPSILSSTSSQHL